MCATRFNLVQKHYTHRLILNQLHEHNKFILSLFLSKDLSSNIPDIIDKRLLHHEKHIVGICLLKH
jgi:hypothetical protein